MEYVHFSNLGAPDHPNKFVVRMHGEAANATKSYSIVRITDLKNLSGNSKFSQPVQKLVTSGRYFQIQACLITALAVTLKLRLRLWTQAIRPATHAAAAALPPP
jgi:hypothetical protein